VESLDIRAVRTPTYLRYGPEGPSCGTSPVRGGRGAD